MALIYKKEKKIVISITRTLFKIWGFKVVRGYALSEIDLSDLWNNTAEELYEYKKEIDDMINKACKKGDLKAITALTVEYNIIEKNLIDRDMLPF